MGDASAALLTLLILTISACLLFSLALYSNSGTLRSGGPVSSLFESSDQCITRTSVLRSNKAIRLDSGSKNVRVVIRESNLTAVHICGACVGPVHCLTLFQHRTGIKGDGLRRCCTPHLVDFPSPDSFPVLLLPFIRYKSLSNC